MKRVLRKRIFREFKENIWRYMALSFVIILCMYLVVSIVGSSNTIIKGTAEHQKLNHLEDGQFETLVPLTEAQAREIESHQVTLEKHFSLDLSFNDGDTLRLFANRESIDLVDLDEGHLAKESDQIVLEKRYCEENDIKLNDKIKIGGMDFVLVGIGTVPDYDAAFKEFSDTAVDSKTFGPAFVTMEAYEMVKDAGIALRAEALTYAFLLGGYDKVFSAKDLKEYLKEQKIEASEVESPSFQKYWARTGGKIDELKDGIEELVDGSKELYDGSVELTDNNDDLNEATAELTDGMKQVNAMLGGALNDKMDDLEEFKNGVKEYTDAAVEIRDGALELKDGINELDEKTDEFIDKYDLSISNLSMFIEKADNPRISGAANDVILNYQAGLVAGVVVMILLTYVISVFVIHSITSESSIIGALYALGAKKNDLISHYITLPVVICFVAGAIGTLLGFSSIGIPMQEADSYSYFSLPKFDIVYEPYLFVYGIIMPALVAAIVNSLVIRKKLSVSALSLIRNEQKQGKASNLNLTRFSFIRKFQIRQLLNELRSGIAIVLGLFISMVILMLGINCYSLCSNVSIDMKKDTKFEYIYSLKFAADEPLKEGYEAYAASLKTQEVLGYTFDASVYGITDDNPYFDLKLPNEADKVVISEQMHTKLALNIGDTLVLTDEEADRMYAFEVADITDYATQLCCFMSIENARDIFGGQDDEYNTIFSSKELDLENESLLASLNAAQIIKSADVFVELMSGMVSVLIIASSVILLLVMYLMMKVMIDRSVYNISLMKVFGYKGKNIKKLYINGNFYIVTIGSLISLPLAKLLMDKIFPFFLSNVAANINLHVQVWIYLVVIGAILALYFIISSLLLLKINKIVPAVALKNRE